MATLRLDQRRVDRLRPRRSAYDVRDRELQGFGVRVLPSGAKRYFIHSQHRGRQLWKIVGEAAPSVRTRRAPGPGLCRPRPAPVTTRGSPCRRRTARTTGRSGATW